MTAVLNIRLKGFRNSTKHDLFCVQKYDDIRSSVSDKRAFFLKNYHLKQSKSDLYQFADADVLVIPKHQQATTHKLRR